MPMTFDTYSGCSFNCLYCFAFFQKSHTVNGYKGVEKSINRDINSVNPDKIKKMFHEAKTGEFSNRGNRQFAPYINNKITMQWGGMADGFDDNEKKYGVSLELLKFFDEIDYPLSISTKGTFFTKDKRYMDLIKKHQHNWHFKISIITNNEEKAKIMEEYVPSPKERFKSMKRLTDAGINVTLRLRPYIIGLSDDYEELIDNAANNGANSVTTEFFCLEARADDELKRKYRKMSELVGYDIWNFYRKHSHGNGYKRLNYTIKSKIIKDMKEIAHRNKMLFYVSDAHHKEKSDDVCCCGCPPHFKVFKGQFAGALQLAKHSPSKTIKWSDFSKDTKTIFNHISWEGAQGFNTSSSKMRATHLNQSLYDYIHEIWNNPKDGKSPYKYFEGILYPIGLDENNDVIYKYNEKKANK